VSFVSTTRRVMDKVVIERRLQPHIFYLCLAVVGKQEGDISLAKENLIREVEKLVEECREK
jgi:hypothetical protein